MLDVDLDQHGHVRNVTVRQSAGEELDNAAMQAAMRWEFAPMLFKGIPTGSTTRITFKF